MTVYSIIVTFNGIQWIQKCLDSLQKSTINTTVVIIDNGSTDGTIEYIETHFPKIHFIRSSKNLGFGSANNSGIKFAYENNADYFFLLNQDAWIEPDTIELLIEAHKNNTQFGIISPIHLDGTGKQLDFNFAKYFVRINPELILSDLIFRAGIKKVYEVPFVNAAAWLISRDCISNVGGFSPVFFHYGEDDNYVHRLKYHGFKIGIDSSTFIFHDRPQKRGNKHFNKLLLTKRSKTINYSNPNLNIKLIKKLLFELRIIRAAFIHGPIMRAPFEILNNILQNSKLKKYRTKTMGKGLHFIDPISEENL